MKRGRRNKMSGTFFSPHRPVASLKMFPCVVSDQIESKEGKHSLLQTTCNRFFLRPNKSTLCFRSCDTFLVLCFIPDISCFGAPPTPHPPSTPSTSSHSHTHAHAHSEFPFPVRQITWTGNGVPQRNMLGQENRKASSRVSRTKCSQSQGKPRGRGSRPFTQDKEVRKESLSHFLDFYFHHTQNTSLRLGKIHTANISL